MHKHSIITIASCALLVLCAPDGGEGTQEQDRKGRSAKHMKNLTRLAGIVVLKNQAGASNAGFRLHQFGHAEFCDLETFAS